MTVTMQSASLPSETVPALPHDPDTEETDGVPQLQAEWLATESVLNAALDEDSKNNNSAENVVRGEGDAAAPMAPLPVDHDEVKDVVVPYQPRNRARHVRGVLLVSCNVYSFG